MSDNSSLGVISEVAPLVVFSLESGSHLYVLCWGDAGSWYIHPKTVDVFSFSRLLAWLDKRWKLPCRSGSASLHSISFVFSWDILGLLLAHRGYQRLGQRWCTEVGRLLSYSASWIPLQFLVALDAKALSSVWSGQEILQIFPQTFSFHMATVICSPDKALKSWKFTLCWSLVENFNSPPKSVCFYLLSRIMRYLFASILSNLYSLSAEGLVCQEVSTLYQRCDLSSGDQHFELIAPFLGQRHKSGMFMLGVAC